MSFRYVVLGAGRQGTAAAYDLARFGEAREVLLADSDAGRARRSAERVNGLLDAGHRNVTVAAAAAVDGTDPETLAPVLRGADAVLSALPYRLNPALARTAVAAGCCFNDLGGHTGAAREVLSLDGIARAASVSAVPDCGLAPGMALVLAVAAMEGLDEATDVRIWCGGLPRSRDLPLGYKLLFDPAGLTNEYTGEAIVLRDGRRVRLPALSEPEPIDFPEPVGPCEAFLTSGGTSTCPWTFEGTLRSFVYKTVRYPGHFDQVRALADLGLFDDEPVRVGAVSVSPRALTHTLMAARLDAPSEPDIVVLRVQASGRKGGRSVAVRLDLLEHSDPATGLTAMERCTGFPAAVVTRLQAGGVIPPGASPQERCVPARRFLEEIRRRGLSVEESIGPVRTASGQARVR